MSERSGEEVTKYNKEDLLHLAGGCMIGLLAGWLLQIEKEEIITYLLSNKLRWVSVSLRILFDTATIAVFYLLLRYFCSKKSRRLTVYYLLSVICSIFAAAAVSILIFLAIESYVMEAARAGFFDTNSGRYFIDHLVFIVFAGIALVFAATFAFLTKRKVTYITYISKEIKTIENDGFGRRLKVNGTDELAGLCMSINHMSQTLLEKQKYEQQLERRKNELIVNVSHDLRSPLTSVIGYVQLLKQTGPSDMEQFQEYITVVDRRLQGLHKMVDELFELTKLNDPDVNMNLEKADLCALLRHLAYENEILLQKRGLTLQKELTENSFEMEMDVGKIVRAVQNLFDNARKYAKENSTVKILTACSQDMFQLQMKNEVNNAEGIQAEKLFERFYIADAARSDTKSSGLGLAIVKRIVKLHGGEITASVCDGCLVLEIKFVKR